MEGITHPVVGLALALLVGLVLGLLGGGGSILAVPIFLYIFGVPPKPAIAMSLAVVGMSAGVGFLSHWRQGTVRLRVALSFGACAMIGAFVTARVAHHVSEQVQLGLFAAFAFSAATMMLRDSLRDDRRVPDDDASDSATGMLDRTTASGPPMATEAADESHFGAMLALQGVGVGALTSLIGAGGGFVIVPALVLLAGMPVRHAVGSSLLIIAMNALSGFVGYIGQVPIQWGLVGWFTGIAALGALVGTRLMRRVPQRRLKQGFAVLIILLGTYLVLRRLHVLP